jgi:predicted metal-dependent hydrolase
MKFDFEDRGFSRYWHSGSPFKSLFWTQLSTAFEPGEKFFIDAARALKSAVDDPALLEEIAEFCRQEGHHTAQHLKFDRMNEAMGVDVASCRRRYGILLKRARGKLDPIQMLAVTCALEHFTASLADQYFTNPEVAAGADPKVAALWAWHAAEEAEHRATCYDIYEAAGGDYRTRVTALVWSWLFILSASAANTVMLLRKDKKLFSRDILEGLSYLVGRRGLITGLGPAFAAYLRRDFHPWQQADGSTTRRWQDDNTRYIQNLDEVIAVA